MPKYNLQFRDAENNHIYDEFGTEILPPVGAKLVFSSERDDDAVIRYYTVLDHHYLYNDRSWRSSGNEAKERIVRVVVEEAPNHSGTKLLEG